MEEQSLLEKLKERLSWQNISNNSIVKKVGKFTITTALIFSLLLTTACGKTNTPATGNSNDDTHISGSNNDNGNNNGGNNQENPYADYSQILQNVLTDEYYQNLIHRRNQDSTFLSTGYFDAHPYGFLEDEGYDIDAIKNGTFECKTMSYILEEEPNNLYIATYVETKAATPYYTEYLIRYTLTDQELSDYNLLHKKNYLHATFINDEISQMKTPVIINKTKCTVEAHKNLYENLKSLPFVKELLNDNNLTDILMKNYDVENGTFEVLLLSASSKSMKSTRKIAVAPLTNGAQLVKENNDGAFYEPYQWMKFYYDTNLDTNSGKNAYIYCSQNYALVKADTTFEQD